jgi:putative ATP-dependent endonuclease of OLD family
MATIQEVDVVNYRSVGHKGARISFPSDSPVVLLGENNAGKSNLVNALQLILGEGWPKSHDPDDHEFYGRQRDRRICIDVYFDPADRYGGRFEQVKYRFDPEADGDPVTFGGKPPLQEFHGDTSYISGDDRESCICIVVGADRNLDYQLSYKSKYTFLSKLMHRFHKALLEDEEVKNDLEDIFADIKDKFHDVDQFSSFVQGLQENLDDLVASMTHRLEVDFEAYNPVNFFRALRLQAVEGDSVRTLDELGTGEEQVLAISFAHAYAQAFHGGIFLIIEEPEAHLHPIMQRWLSRRIHSMSEDGLQVLMTTHSPAFVDLLNLDGLVLVKKDEHGTYTVQQSAQDLVEYCTDTGVPADRVNANNILPFYKANATQEILSGFFADKVVLVEGPTEELALPQYLKEVGFDVLTHGVEILGVGGKGNLAKWWRMFTLYGIPTYVIFDNDDSDDGNETRRRDALEALDAEDNEINAVVGADEWLIQEEYAVFGTDFEDALRDRFPNYEDLEAEAAERIGNNSKPFIARHVARQMQYEDNHPGWDKFEDLAEAISNLEV